MLSGVEGLVKRIAAEPKHLYLQQLLPLLEFLQHVHRSASRIPAHHLPR
jgi:hypothetical protein